MMSQRQIGLIFHGIGTPARRMEAGEAPYWVSVAQFETVLDLIARQPLPERFRISFDDGNISDHDIALPRLTAHRLRADFFVLSGRIGQPGSLDRDHVRALQRAGMTIGSHGVAHRDWRRLDDAGLAEELRASRICLEAIIGVPVTTAGIPFGSYDRRVLQALRGAGYQAAYSSDRGEMDPTAFLRPRTSITAAMGPGEIAAILAGQMSPIARLRRVIGMARKRVGV